MVPRGGSSWGVPSWRRVSWQRREASNEAPRRVEWWCPGGSSWGVPSWRLSGASLASLWLGLELARGERALLFSKRGQKKSPALSVPPVWSGKAARARPNSARLRGAGRSHQSSLSRNCCQSKEPLGRRRRRRRGGRRPRAAAFSGRTAVHSRGTRRRRAARPPTSPGVIVVCRAPRSSTASAIQRAIISRRACARSSAWCSGCSCASCQRGSIGCGAVICSRLRYKAERRICGRTAAPTQENEQR